MAVKPQMTIWVVALAAVLTYGIVYLILSHQDNNQAIIAENQTPQTLPKAYFYEPGGSKLSLADFKGRPVIVNLWATWCPPCIAELPSLDKLQAKMTGKGLAVVAIALDRGEDMTPVTDFLRKQRIEHLTPYWDKDRQVREAWNAENLPVSYLIDRNGVIVKKLEGTFVWDKGEMLKTVRKLVK
jgi:thiol-disulfide isomerase/thioredoxin